MGEENLGGVAFGEACFIEKTYTAGLAFSVLTNFLDICENGALPEIFEVVKIDPLKVNYYWHVV